MNVYMVMEDGESRIFAAPTMVAAIEAAWHDNLRAEAERLGRPYTDAEAADERAQWEVHILESVTLVGELENVDDLRARLEERANRKEPA